MKNDLTLLKHASSLAEKLSTEPEVFVDAADRRDVVGAASLHEQLKSLTKSIFDFGKHYL